MKSLREILPRVSQSVIDANPQYSTQVSNQSDKSANVTRTRRGSMNATEAEYALILEQMKRKGEILRYEFEGITLRWADMRYTPDFIMFMSDVLAFPTVKLIEVKGGHIWDRDIVRFKGARAYWPEFAFEMHQRKAGSWKRIH